MQKQPAQGQAQLTQEQGRLGAGRGAGLGAAWSQVWGMERLPSEQGRLQRLRSQPQRQQGLGSERLKQQGRLKLEPGRRECCSG